MKKWHAYEEVCITENNFKQYFSLAESASAIPGRCSFLHNGYIYNTTLVQ